MINIKKHIPNFLTCCNLLCGCLGITEVFHTNLQNASLLILIACIFDFLDGFAARILKVTSPIGKELDSLADVVTFGVLPSMIIFQLITHAILIEANLSPFIPLYFYLKTTGTPMAYIAFTIAIFSALRLAKFNIDMRQSDSFIGVPTPANAILISSIPLILPTDHLHNTLFNLKSYSQVQNIVSSTYFLIAVSLLMSLLLVSELPLFALKFKNFSWADNKMKYILIGSSIVLLVLLQWAAIPLIIFLYIILSVIGNKVLKAKS